MSYIVFVNRLSREDSCLLASDKGTVRATSVICEKNKTGLILSSGLSSVLSSECAQSIFLGGPFSEHNVMHVRYEKGGESQTVSQLRSF